MTCHTLSWQTHVPLAPSIPALSGLP
jgi:hypothetical protein